MDILKLFALPISVIGVIFDGGCFLYFASIGEWNLALLFGLFAAVNTSNFLELTK